MRLHAKCITLIGLVVFSGWDQSIAIEPQDGFKDVRVSRLASTDEKERKAAFANLSFEHDVRVAHLVALANATGNAEPTDSQLLAMRLLVHCRSIEVVPILLKHICFQGAAFRSADVLGPYPCAQLLRGMGITAVPRIIHVLVSTDPRHISDEAIVIIWNVLQTIYVSEFGDTAELDHLLARKREREGNPENLRRILALR